MIKTKTTIVLVPLLIVPLAAAALPPVPVPAGNPITEPKRVLGKILFWDEQLSADSTVACATCHMPSRGGTDPRRARQPGPDGLINTADDIFASPGVVRSDVFENYLRDQVFGALPQITSRTANSMINAAYAPSLFWDGRAASQFVDPVTGLVVLNNNAALESQAAGPPASSVEMGHDGIDWPRITAKLQSAQPLALATSHPPDVAAVLGPGPSYPDLFTAAFGDGEITAARVAMAIATYERTLIADDTPWDRFQAGNATAMTPGQIAGWNFFQTSACNVCHVAPLFTDNSFRNIGVRPPPEDFGRQIVTGNPADRGRFKVPGLRNVGLKNSFMHNGDMTTLTEVIQFYTRAPGARQMFQGNLDPLMPVPVPPNVAPALQDFLTNALTDARVRDEVFPFDRPTLFTQRPADQPANLGGGVAGSGGIVPAMIANTPPMIGNADFKLGLDRARGGATARLALSSTPPVSGRITPMLTFPLTTASAGAAGQGVATVHWPLTSSTARAGQTVFAQWIIDDPSAPGGQAVSNVTRLTFFCGSMGCPDLCPADINNDKTVSVQDLFDFLALYFSGHPAADINASVSISVQDIFDYLTAYFAGC